MRIGQRLLAHTIFIVVFCVLTSTFIVGLVGYFLASRGIESQVKHFLMTLCDVKKFEIQNFFEMSRKQLQNFSNDPDVMAAMQGFAKGFKEYGKNLSESRLSKYKTEMIEHYFNEFQEEYQRNNGPHAKIDIPKLLNLMEESSFLLQYYYILANPNPINEKYKLSAANDASEYSQVHKRYHNFLLNFMRDFNFRDIFLIDTEGNIVYTAEKGIDFTTSLLRGPYKDTQLASVFRIANSVIDRDFTVLSEFKPYPPSYDDLEGFIASPIFDENGQHIGVMAFELSLEDLAQFTTSDRAWEKEGLGETGEIYIAGPDFKLRTNSRFLMEDQAKFLDILREEGVDNKTLEAMVAKNTTIGLQTVRAEIVQPALEGKKGVMEYEDYRGREVVAAYQPLDIPDLNWAIVVKMDEDEAFATSDKLGLRVIIFSLCIMVLLLLLGIVLGFRLEYWISTPIEQFSQIVHQLARDRDLTKRIVVEADEEIKDMADSINALFESFQQTCEKTLETTAAVNSAAERLMTYAEHLKGDDKTSDLQEPLLNTGENLKELSQRLGSISTQFKVLEEKIERTHGW